MKLVRLLAPVGCLALIGICGGWAPREDLAEREFKKLHGTWEIVSQEEDGKAVPRQNYEQTRVVIAGEGYKTEVRGKVVAQGTWKFAGERGKFLEVDEVTESADRAAAGTTPAIYEWVNENTFRWCQPAGKGNRPTEFTAKKGSHQTLIEYRRVKK